MVYYVPPLYDFHSASSSGDPSNHFAWNWTVDVSPESIDKMSYDERADVVKRDRFSASTAYEWFFSCGNTTIGRELNNGDTVVLATDILL